MKAQGATVRGHRLVDHNDVITARGVTSGVDLALWLIERFVGANVAADVEYRMEYERRGVVWREDTTTP